MGEKLAIVSRLKFVRHDFQYAFKITLFVSESSNISTRGAIRPFVCLQRRLSRFLHADYIVDFLVFRFSCADSGAAEYRLDAIDVVIIRGDCLEFYAANYYSICFYVFDRY